MKPSLLPTNPRIKAPTKNANASVDLDTFIFSLLLRFYAPAAVNEAATANTKANITGLNKAKTKAMISIAITNVLMIPISSDNARPSKTPDIPTSGYLLNMAIFFGALTTVEVAWFSSIVR
jgi:hypothetical protein